MKAYLKNIQINEGMFSSEKTVCVRDYQGDESSGFIENQHIKKDKLEVTVIQRKNNLVLIKLPGRMLEVPGDKGHLTVKKQDLQYI